MKKIYAIAIVALAFALTACNKDNGPAAGKSVGEIYVTAKSGARTVLVKKTGLWRVTSLEDWISTDVEGRSGEGAFTVYYGSNESDFVQTNSTRRGAVVIRGYEDNVADTLYIRQQGTPDGTEYASAAQDSYIEFIETPLTKMNILFANFNGNNSADAATSFIRACDAQIVAVSWNDESGMATIEANFNGSIVRNGKVAIINRSEFRMVPGPAGETPVSIAAEIDGVNYQVALFDEDQAYYPQMSSLLEAGYNNPSAGAKWIIGGTFYFLSSMEVGYSDSPNWYPLNPLDPAFDADRYAQTNNLTDCIWMASRKYNPTWTSGDMSWRADYVYASNSVWNAATAVSTGDVPVSGAEHRTVNMTIKY